MNDIIHVADFTLTNGHINRCCVWDEHTRGMDLKYYISNPMDLKHKHSVLHVQNTYTSVMIDTEHIQNIKIRTINSSEW